MRHAKVGVCQTHTAPAFEASLYAIYLTSCPRALRSTLSRVSRTSAVSPRGLAVLRVEPRARCRERLEDLHHRLIDRAWRWLQAWLS